MIDQPLIWRTGDAAETNRVLVINKDLEVVAGMQAKLFPNAAGKDNLTFLGQHGGHSKKIIPSQVRVSTTAPGQTHQKGR